MRPDLVGSEATLHLPLCAVITVISQINENRHKCKKLKKNPANKSTFPHLSVKRLFRMLAHPLGCLFSCC